MQRTCLFAAWMCVLLVLFCLPALAQGPKQHSENSMIVVVEGEAEFAEAIVKVKVKR